MPPAVTVRSKFSVIAIRLTYSHLRLASVNFTKNRGKSIFFFENICVFQNKAVPLHAFLRGLWKM